MGPTSKNGLNRECEPEAAKQGLNGKKQQSKRFQALQEPRRLLRTQLAIPFYRYFEIELAQAVEHLSVQKQHNEEYDDGHIEGDHDVKPVQANPK